MTGWTTHAKPRRRFVGAAAAAVMAAALLAGCSSRKDDAQPSSTVASNVKLTPAQLRHIHFYTVAPSQYSRTIEAPGTVDFDNDQATSVLSPFSGPVSRLVVSLGQQVSKGDPLAVVDSPDFASAVSTYRKALVAARNARRVADVDRDLIQHEGISQREAAQAQTDAASAEADRDAAFRALVSLNADPGTIRDIQAGRSASRLGGVIRSPISGTVVEKLITPGQLLQGGTTAAFTVANLSRVWVMAQVSSSDLASIAVHDPAEVRPGAGSGSFLGTVDYISASVDPNSRSVMARVVVANPRDLLKKQMYVDVLIRSRQDSIGLLVPVSAILRDDVNLPYVYLVQPDGSFARRHVSLGYRAGDRYDVTAGLQTGDRIVADGAIFIQFIQNQ